MTTPQIRENTPGVRGGPNTPERFLCKVCRVSLTENKVRMCWFCEKNGGRRRSRKSIGYWLKKKE